MASTLALSLVSHTNVGKTTLARTLLRRDIGEVRDAAHVTLAAERHTLVTSPEGDRLELWDTPGFGDSLRMAQRLARAANPIGWFLNEVWDRYTHRALWSSQRAVRHVLDQADVVLYLLNASEAPEDSAYVDAELTVLDLLAKPAIVLLNQLGEPRSTHEEAAEVQRWRERCAGHACVRDVLALDAFARCWVQEGTLLQAVASVLPGPRAESFARLIQAWQERERVTWRASMARLAQRLARAALDRETIAAAGWSGRVREVGAALGLRREGATTPRELAMQALAERLDADIRASTDHLIQLHGLSGQATQAVLLRLAEHFALRQPVSEGKAAVLGGIVTGALAGLKADIVSGGLTMGGGLLAGGVLGALSAAGLTRGYNLLRGTDQPALTWTEPVLDDLVRSALLGYLAVAHYGRGRGDWAAAEHPAFWSNEVEGVLVGRQAALKRLWAQRSFEEGGTDAATKGEALRAGLQDFLLGASRELLLRLYPQAGAALADPSVSAVNSSAADASR
jgi:hypothetical protein